MGKFRSLKRQMEKVNKVDPAVSAARIYKENKDKSAFGDLSDSGRKNIREISHEYVGKFFETLQREGFIEGIRDIKKCDTINYYLSVAPEFIADTGGIPRTNPDSLGIKECKKNWLLLIPPLKEGVLRINKRRYMKYAIEEINEEEKSVTCSIADYSFVNNIWLMETWIDHCKAVMKDGSVTVEAQGLTTDEIIQTNDLRLTPYSIRTARLTTDEIIRINTPAVKWNDADKTIMQKVVIPYLEKTAPSKYEVTVNSISFFQAIAETNYWLLQGKPKAQRSQGRKVEGVYDGAENNQKPQIVRALVNGITIKSKKMPRVANEETIRHYKVAAWNTRGHIRTLKSGKQIYIHQTIHHRQCLLKEPNAGQETAQTIIQVKARDLP